MTKGRGMGRDLKAHSLIAEWTASKAYKDTIPDWLKKKPCPFQNERH